MACKNCKTNPFSRPMTTRWVESYRKIVRVIWSCKTTEHLEVANEMVNQYVKVFGVDEFSTKMCKYKQMQSIIIK